MTAQNRRQRVFQPGRKTTMSGAENNGGGRNRMAPARRPIFGEQQRFMLFLIAPAALLLGLFQVVPIVIGANASFRNWALYNPKKDWIGLDHYRAVLGDPAFLEVVLPNTFVFMLLSVAGSLVLGLALA